MKTRTIWIVVTVVAVMGVIVLLRARHPMDSRSLTAEAKRGRFVMSVETRGEVQAVNSRIVGRSRGNFWSSSQIIQLVDEGTTVAAGDFLAQLDTGEAQRELEEKKNSLLNARTGLASAKAEQESKMAELEGALKKEELAFEEAKLRSEQMKFEAEVRRKEQEIELEKAKLALEEAKQRIEAQKAIARAEIKKAELKVRQAENDVHSGEKALQSLTITAPEAGLVIYRRTRGEKIKVGDSTWPGMELIELPDLSKMKVLTKVNETDVKEVKVGQKVRVTVDALGGESFPGEVSRMANLARLEKGARVKTFDTDVLFDEPGEDLRPGMSAHCRIIIGELQDVVFIPLDAVFEEEGQSLVTLADGQRRPVTLGQHNRDMVVVSQGLKEGERVRLQLVPLSSTKEKPAEEPKTSGGSSGD